MSEFNYLREKKRYLDSIGKTGVGCDGIICGDCMFLGYNNGYRGMFCFDFELNHPEEATEMVRKWAEEHPEITNADKFEEVFGICAGDKCPPIDCGGIVCADCEYHERKWWNEEYKKPKRSDESK